MFILNIPEPCHENWEEMTPNAKGRFCGSCQKIVVDFTQMSDEQIKNYFLQHSSGKTCGRFLSTQLNRPLENQTITINANWYQKLPFSRQVFYAVALFFVLGVSSCELSGGKTQTLKADTIGASKESVQELGKVDRVINRSDSTALNPPKVKMIQHPSPVLTGEVIGEPMPPKITQGAPLWVEPPVDTTWAMQYKLKIQKADSLIGLTEPAIKDGIPVRKEIKPDSACKIKSR